MKQKVTEKQLFSTIKLIKNLKEFVDKKYGMVNNLNVLTNNMTPDVIYVKYEKEFSSGGNRDYEFKIAAINQLGEISFIDNGFKNIFEKSAFLSECRPLNIENEYEYEKID